MQAKQGENQAALPPLLASSKQDKLLRNQTKPKHSGEGDKANESQHLSENLTIAANLVRDLCESGLAGARHHTVYRARSHIVPLLGVRVDACRVVSKKLTKQDGKGVEIADVDDIREHQLAAEAEHLPCRSKIELECWPPRREEPGHNLCDEDKADCLRHDSPIGETLDGHHDTDDSREKHSCQRADAGLPDHQVSEKVGTLNCAET